MYYPYFRGKQFELITIREMAEVMAKAKFVPIIEPVKEALKGLQRALKKVCKSGGQAIVIINPHYGELKGNGTKITKLLQDDFSDGTSISPGILLREKTTLSEAIAHFNEHKEQRPVFIHAGFTESKALAAAFGDDLKFTRHAFVEMHCSPLYQKPFKDAWRVLIGDGYERREKNSDYVDIETERFSELHLTFDSHFEMNAFADFLTAGDSYSEKGGPAYAVAIHLTYLDEDRDNEMHVYHFVSDTNDTATDPGGKFGEALQKLIDSLDSGQSKLIDSSAIKEFRDLHVRGHFPGLGHVKKLSMNHHIETLANHFT